MKKNVASQAIGIQMISSTDGSDFTGTVTVYITGDAGTQAIGTVGSGVCTHEGRGYHTYAPAQAETNYDLIAFTFAGSGAITSTVQVFTGFPQTVDNATNISAIKTKTDFLPSATAGAAGGVFIAGTNAATVVTTSFTTTFTGNLTGNVGGSVASVASGGITTASFAAGAIDASAIATDAIGSAEIAASAVTKIQAGLATPTNITAGTITTATNVTTVNDKTGYSLTVTPPTAATIASTLLGTTGLTVRALDSIADASITVGDCLVAGLCAGAGKETVVGTAYTVKSPSTGTVIRTFVLDSSSAPTSRT